MKLSQYAKQQGISYSTALRWWHQGAIRGYQAPSGTIIVETESKKASTRERVAIYARVSSAEHKENLERQAERLTHYCTVRGYQVAHVVKEIASGVNDSRPKLLALLKDQQTTRIVVEHKDRLTRFGFRYLETLLELQGRTTQLKAAEKCADWKTASNRARARSGVGKAVAARKAAEQVKAAEHLPITVTHLPLDQLRSRAIASYNLFHEELLWERGHDYERASEQSDPLFLERITVNAIRHHLTEYETHLEEVAGQGGVSVAGRVIRRRVSAQIAAHYPEYAEECRRQIQARSIEADYAIS
jgi:putative resolvase